MYKANLSYRLLCRYLSDTIDAGLINFESGDCYVLTTKGKEFLNRHEEYSKRCKSLEEHLNHVNDEKIILEKLSFSPDRVNNNLNRSAKESKR